MLLVCVHLSNEIARQINAAIIMVSNKEWVISPGLIVWPNLY